MEATPKELTILVTGGAGFLGQHITKHLLIQDIFPVKEVRTFDIQPFQAVPELEVKAQNGRELRHIIGNICNADDVTRAIRGVDAVFHTCSLIDVCPYPDTEKIKAVNVTGTENIIRACEDNCVQFVIYTSSIEVANTTKTIKNVTENTAVIPPEKYVYPAYGSTKWEAEKRVIWANNRILRNGNIMKTCALRPPGIYGEGDCIWGQTFQLLKKTGIVMKIGEPSGKTQWAYAGNIAWAHVLALRSLLETQEKAEEHELAGQALFIGDNSPIGSAYEFMHPFALEMGIQMPFFAAPFWLMIIVGLIVDFLAWLVSPFHRLQWSLGSATVKYLYTTVYFSWEKSENVLGYRPLYTFETAFKKSVMFYKNYARKL